MIWNLILIGLNLVGLGIAFGKHGESRGTHNGWHSLIAIIIVFWCYYKVGIFNFIN